ncbi:hypothetical protein M1B34_28365 [Pseudomonas sp. MAFF 302030]|uniref:Uncharacterized protein n=1 Tax=Pseudomonas morbosilactucae TaxID=2938197 RepID=A0A9X1Z0F6_9PSED|nr:hypothetical protein [Pseudomonas morbosilactucae]MCK9801477.1 hypothetical protein [Pseudomonas morbosilactucae]
MTINELAQGPQIQPSTGLIEYLSAQPLYALCSDQILHACELIDRCCLRIQTDDINSDLNTLCIKVTQLEETISQYAMTGPYERLADLVRQFSDCYLATDDQTHAAYIMACAVKALEVMSYWMRDAEQDALPKGLEMTSWPWDLYSDFLERQVNEHDRIEALELYVVYLKPIVVLASLKHDELRPLAASAIREATRRKGGVHSGHDRNQEMSARDAALVEKARTLLRNGMPRRFVTTAVHRWLEQQVAKPPKDRLKWIALETDKALTRKRVEAILKHHQVLLT